MCSADRMRSKVYMPGDLEIGDVVELAGSCTDAESSECDVGESVTVIGVQHNRGFMRPSKVIIKYKDGSTVLSGYLVGRRPATIEAEERAELRQSKMIFFGLVLAVVLLVVLSELDLL